MFFQVLPRGRPLPATPNRAFLVRDQWDDYSFRTTFRLRVVDDEGHVHTIGSVKVGEEGLPPHGGSPELPAQFEFLEPRFFSLGQGEDYYANLNRLDAVLRSTVLEGLNDLAFDLSILDRVIQEPVLQTSLLRSVAEDSVRGRLHRVATGDTHLSSYQFTYELPPREDAEPCALSFKISPTALPPTNVHILIGRNGVGKTTCLRGMAHTLVEKLPDPTRHGRFVYAEAGNASFANLVSVTFSAFDPFDCLDEQKDGPLPYHYIGLRSATDDDEEGAPKGVDDLADDFVRSAKRCRTGVTQVRWLRALRALESDPIFRAANVTRLGDTSSQFGQEARRIYNLSSSGHKIVLLTITQLVEKVDERSLVLLDEPEAHLHPPLLSAFIRALSDLLLQRNGVAIVATHSPVVLQEAPASCVWLMRRSGHEVRAERPRIETFGEHVGVLTSEVFGLEVTHCGFHKLLEEAVSSATSYDEVLGTFSGQLGAEARAIVRGLLAANHPASE